MSGPPRERGSVRNVTFQGDNRTHFCEVRSNPQTGLRVGSRVWIEVGAKWADHEGKQFKVPGRWRECVVVDGVVNTSADVVVRFASK
ncbi:MAG TPA: hypothetical protein VF447_12665 [Terriglobales bacterium]